MSTIQIQEPEGKTIKSLVATLNVIFNKIEQKLDDVNNGIKDLKEGTLLQDVAYAKAAADEAVAVAERNSTAIIDIKKYIEQIQFNYQSVQKENVHLKKQVNHLENYSRRSNLVIRGIPEVEGESLSVFEYSVMNVMSEHMQLDEPFINGIKFVRCNRICNKQNIGEQ